MASNLEHDVRQAKKGNKQALETVVGNIQERIYGLALRMLGNAEDAEDETQEILIKVITHLSDFREESAFSSWMYRVACNHLLTTRKRRNEREWHNLRLSGRNDFGRCRQDLSLDHFRPGTGSSCRGSQA
jgi:DNA-directed RNA polymerase specialized sigma24 family protein